MPVVKNMRDLFDSEQTEALNWSYAPNEASDAEKRIHAMVPGDDPSTHPVMEAMPNVRCLNWNPMRVKRAWEAGDLSEREVLSYERATGENVRPNQSDPIPDSGGITQPYTGVGCVEGVPEGHEPMTSEGPNTSRDTTYPAARGRKAPAGQPSARGFAVVKVD
jgi:hypothetical protein